MRSDIAEHFQKEKPTLAKLVGLETKRRSFQKQKVSKKPLIISLTLVVLIISGGFAVWFFVNSNSGTSVPPVPVLAEPTPFFATESERTIDADVSDQLSFLRLLESAAGEGGRTGTIRYIKIRLRDDTEERFATLTDLLGFYRITPPTNTLRYIEEPLMTFFYYGERGNRFGFAAKTRDVQRTFRDLLIWEASLASDLFPLLFNETTDLNPNAPFEDRTYRNIDWRFLKLSQEKDVGLGHMVFPARDVLVVTTSKKSMETVIDRLFGTR